MYVHSLRPKYSGGCSLGPTARPVRTASESPQPPEQCRPARLQLPGSGQTTGSKGLGTSGEREEARFNVAGAVGFLSPDRLRDARLNLDFR